MSVRPVLAACVICAAVSSARPDPLPTAPATSPATRGVADGATMLRQLRERYAARRAELEGQQHARSVERDPDVASPAAAAETLRELVRAQPEAHRRAADAKDAYDRAIALVSNGEELPAVRRAIERDPQLRSMRDAVREFERLAPPMPAPPEYGQRRARLLEAARRNRDDATASARARAEASVLEDLRRRHDEAARQRRDLDERAERAIAALEFRPLQAQLDLLTTLVRELDAAIDAAERGGPPAGTGANGNRRGNAQENANGDVPSN